MTNKIETISRVTRSKQDARKAYNKLSRWYDVFAGSYENKYTETAVNSLAIKSGERVLEIGFGTGHGIVELARKVGEYGKIHGIDISDGMREVTQEKVKKAALSGSVELIIGDAASLPYKSNTFDAILISFTLELFDTPEIPTVLGQCGRVLKNGGRIGVVAMAKGDGSLGVSIYEWLHKKFPVWIDCRPIYARESLADAGFKILELEEFSMAGLSGERVLAIKPE